MNPPARSWPTTRGASGAAMARTTSQAATIHHRWRTMNRPRRAKESEASSTEVTGDGDADMPRPCYPGSADEAAAHGPVPTHRGAPVVIDGKAPLLASRCSFTNRSHPSEDPRAALHDLLFATD